MSSLTHSLAHSLAHSITHSLTHSLTLTLSLMHSLAHSLTHSLTFLSSLVENPELTAPLSQAQVILNGLNNLFDACEQCTLNMTEIVEDIDVTTEWRSVDLLVLFWLTKTNTKTLLV